MASLPKLVLGESTKKNVDKLNNVIDEVNLHGPNILDNPDFKINQRGLTEYPASTSAVWTIDRWWALFANVSVSDDHITLTAQSTEKMGSLRQNIYNSERFKGKYLTFTADCDLLTENSGVRLQFKCNNTWSPIAEFSAVGRNRIHATWKVPDDLSTEIEAAILIQIPTESETTKIDIYNVKVEVGQFSTEFVAPNPIDEILKIQSMNNDGSPRVISDKTLPSTVNSQMVSNPNILDNPDFRINQRSVSSISLTAGDSAVTDWVNDRWFFSVVGKDNTGVYNATTHTIESQSVSNKSGFYANIKQSISDPVKFAGSVMTLSCSMSELDAPAEIHLLRDNGPNTDITVIAKTAYDMAEMKTLTFTMPNDLTEDSRVYAVLQSQGSAKFNWAKLELGTVATQFVPPANAEELLKCQSKDNLGNSRLVSDSILPSLMNSRMMSNPNLLDNPDFMINQRGSNLYTSGYTVDRWYLATNGLCSLSYAYDGITLTVIKSPSASTHVFWQDLIDYSSIIEINSAPRGKHTLSVCVLNVTGKWAARIRTVNESGEYVASYYTSFLTSGINTVSVDLPETEFISTVSINVHPCDPGSLLKIAWFKLEQGMVSTQFVAPNYTLELLKCQRYYVEYNPDARLYANVGDGYGYINNNAIIYADLPTRMRAYPTLSVQGSWALSTTGEPSSDIPVSTIVNNMTSNLSLNRIILMCTGKNANTITTGNYYQLRASNDSTARLSLSADL